MGYHVKFPNFTFERGRKQTTTNVSFSFEIWLLSGSKNPTVGDFFSLALERTYLCVSRQRANAKLLYTKEV